MWVLVVCFCLFLSGLYLYIIIYKAASVLQIAVLRITDITQMQICMLHQRVTQHARVGMLSQKHKRANTPQTEHREHRLYPSKLQVFLLLWHKRRCCQSTGVGSRRQLANEQTRQIPNTEHRELEHTHTHKCETCTQT